MAFPFNPKCPDPEEARQMKQKLIAEGAYYNINRQYSADEQAKAIAKVSQLDEIIAGRRKWLD
jgi:hypothetical protein